MTIWSTDDVLRSRKPCHSRGMLVWSNQWFWWIKVRTTKNIQWISKAEKWVNFLSTLVIGHLYGFRKMVVSERFGSEKFNPLWKQHKNKMEVYFQPGSGLQTIDVLHGNNSIPPGPHFEITARQFQFFSHFEDCIPRANFDTFLWALAGKPKWTTGKRWMVKHEDLQPPIIFWEGFWRADPFISILTLYWTGKQRWTCDFPGDSLEFYSLFIYDHPSWS